MHLESDGEPVCRRPGEAGLRAELGQAARLLGNHLENGHCLVQNSDTAVLSFCTRLSHVSILWSRYLGCPAFGKVGENPMAHTLAEKVWDAHVVRQGSGAEPDLLYIDLH